MSLSIEYHDLVDLDLFDGWAWYEGQQVGLGDRFLDAVNATVVRAAGFPGAGTPTLRNTNDVVVERKIAIHRFPYAIRYRVIDNTLVVMAVTHQHRRPEFGMDREP